MGRVDDAAKENEAVERPEVINEHPPRTHGGTEKALRSSFIGDLRDLALGAIPSRSGKS
jgi:hypothetical protein